MAKCQYNCSRNVLWGQVHSSHIHSNHKTSLHYNSKQTSRSRCNKSHPRMLTHTSGRDVTKSHRMSTHTAGQNGNQTHSAAKDKPTDLGVVARAHRSWEWWPLSVARVGPLGPCPYPSHPAPSSPLVPSAPSSHQTETHNINVPGG